MPRGRKKKRKKRKRKCVRLVVKNVTNYFRIDVIDVNDETPKLVNNTELEVWAGSYTTLTSTILGKAFKIDS